MKTYSTFPLVSLSIMVGMFLAAGITLAIYKETILGVGGSMVVAAFAIALVADRIYGRCRIVEIEESVEQQAASPVK